MLLLFLTSAVRSTFPAAEVVSVTEIAEDALVLSKRSKQRIYTGELLIHPVQTVLQEGAKPFHFTLKCRAMHQIARLIIGISGFQQIFFLLIQDTACLYNVLKILTVFFVTFVKFRYKYGSPISVLYQEFACASADLVTTIHAR